MMNVKLWKTLLAVMLVLSCLSGAVLAEPGVEEPYPGLNWNGSLVDALILPNEYAVVFNEVGLDGTVHDVIFTVGSPAGDYVAEFALLDYYDDTLSGVYYMIREDCSSFAFDNLDAAIRRRFGDPICFDPSLVSVLSYDELFDAVGDMAADKQFESVHPFIDGYQGVNFRNKITDYRVWEVSENVTLVLGYYQAGLFFLEDYIGVTLICER